MPGRPSDGTECCFIARRVEHFAEDAVAVLPGLAMVVEAASHFRNLFVVFERSNISVGCSQLNTSLAHADLPRIGRF